MIPKIKVLDKRKINSYDILWDVKNLKNKQRKEGEFSCRVVVAERKRNKFLDVKKAPFFNGAFSFNLPQNQLNNREYPLFPARKCP